MDKVEALQKACETARLVKTSLNVKKKKNRTLNFLAYVLLKT